MQLYKIYRSGNYISIEWTDTGGKTYKKRHSCSRLTYEKGDTTFNLFQDLKGLQYNPEFSAGLKADDSPYTEIELEAFFNENTAYVAGAPGGGGAGDASAANQAIGNTTLASINTRVLPQSVIPSHVELLSNTSQTLFANTYKSISLIVMSGTINIDVDGVVINNFPTNYTETWGNGVGFITKPITIAANTSTRVVINLTK